MSRRRPKQARQKRNMQYSIALPCVVADRVPPKEVLQTSCLTNGQNAGDKQQSSRSCLEVRVDYRPSNRRVRNVGRLGTVAGLL